MALKTNFQTINSWTTQFSLWGGVWVVIAISSLVRLPKVALSGLCNIFFLVHATYCLLESDEFFLSECPASLVLIS